jgi:hypothetical protein
VAENRRFASAVARPIEAQCAEQPKRGIGISELACCNVGCGSWSFGQFIGDRIPGRGVDNLGHSSLGVAEQVLPRAFALKPPMLRPS